MFMQMLELIRWVALAFIVFFDVIGLTALALLAVHLSMNYRRRLRGEAEQSLEAFMAAMDQALDRALGRRP